MLREPDIEGWDITESSKAGTHSHKGESLTSCREAVAGEAQIYDRPLDFQRRKDNHGTECTG